MIGSSVVVGLNFARSIVWRGWDVLVVIRSKDFSYAYTVPYEALRKTDG